MRTAAFLISLALSGCAYVEPLIQNFNLISVPEEKQIGAKIAAEIAREKPLAADPVSLARVRSIGGRLVQALSYRDFDYQFHVVEDRTPNAFTIPGGSIYVHTGLLEFSSEDQELAGVLAHEIAHAHDRHPAKNLSRVYGAEYLSGLIFKGNPSKLKTLALQLAAGGILSRYSREDERRADEIGYYLLKRAGFETSGLLRFLRKLQSIGSGGMPIPFLSTHPPTPERIARLEALESGSIPEPSSETLKRSL